MPLRLLLPLLLLAPQDGGSLPLTEKNLGGPAAGDRLLLAYYYPREDSPPRAHLLEMAKTGIDVALVLGGDAAALQALGRAVEELDREGRDRPRLAPVPDLASLGKADLGSEEGKKRLYGLVSGFYARIPPRAWAVVDGRPLVWLLPPPAGMKHDLGLVEALSELGKKDFDGRAFYVVADVAWRDLPADRKFAWGGAHDGPRDLPVVSLGPGCSSPERARDDGRFYERSWYIALRLEPRWIAIESWNGTAAGTDIAESKEFKRKYVEATQSYVRRFRLGEKTSLPKGKWTGAAKAIYTAKYLPHEQGLQPVEGEGAAPEFIQLRGIAMLASKEVKGVARRLLAIDVDDTFTLLEKRSFDLSVEFLDSGDGEFSLEYDSWDPALTPAARAVKSAGVRRFSGTGEWRTETFDLPDARFANGQPGGSDFRLVTEKRGIAVRRISVTPK